MDVVDLFPEECRRVLEDLRTVYRVEAKAKELKLNAADRFTLHQAESAPVMSGLAEWMNK